MIDVTDLKAKADALATIANSVIALKAAPTVTTLAQAQAGVSGTNTAFNDLVNAMQDVQNQMYADHPLDFNP